MGAGLLIGLAGLVLAATKGRNGKGPTFDMQADVHANTYAATGSFNMEEDVALGDAVASVSVPPLDQLRAVAAQLWERNGNPLGLGKADGSLLCLAIMCRESAYKGSVRIGEALDRKYQLDGAGDPGARSKPNSANLGRWKIVGRDPKRPDTHSMVLPPDGRGWGRGLVQIDYWAHRAWFDVNPRWWELPTQIGKQIEVLRDAWRANFDAVSPGDRLRVAVAAYNCGPTNARTAYRNTKNPDTATTGGDYSADVFSRRSLLASRLGGIA